jgi:hypothetical protein
VLIPSRGPHLASTHLSALLAGERRPSRRRPCRRRLGPGSSSVLPRTVRGTDQQRRPGLRGNSQRRPGDGDDGDGGPGRRGGRHPTISPKASWCSYHQGIFKPPIDHRLAGGRSGPHHSEDPHREATCGVGPVTGTAGSEQLDGEVDVTQPPQPEGLLVLIPPGDSQKLRSTAGLPVGDRGRTGTKIHTARQLAAPAR